MTHLYHGKTHFIAGVSVIESFPNDFQSLNRFYPSNEDEISKSYYEQPEENYEMPRERYIPKILDNNVFEAIVSKYSEQKKVKTYDSRVLFEYYMTLRKLQKESFDKENMEQTQKFKFSGNNSKKISKETQERLLKNTGLKNFSREGKGLAEKEKFFRSILSDYHPEDVRLTLKHFENETKEQENITKFFLQNKQKVAENSSKPKSKFSANTLRRLYPEIVKIRNEDIPSDRAFVELLLFYYRMEFSDDLQFHDSAKLTGFYFDTIGKGDKAGDIGNKDRKDQLHEKVNKLLYDKTGSFDRSVNKDIVQGLIDDYYGESVAYMNKKFREKKGFEALPQSEEEKKTSKYKDKFDAKTYETEIKKKTNYGEDLLFEFWLEKTKNYKKTNKKASPEELVDFQSDENLRKFIKKYLLHHYQSKKKPMDGSELRNDQIEKPKKNPKLNREPLEKPKDRLRAGKVLLNLKKMFPHDRILRKMILEEFKNNRIAKQPGEYEVFDSDEEDQILFPKSEGKNFKRDPEKEAIEKENKIKELFEMDMNDFKETKEKSLSYHKEKFKKIISEDRELHSYLKEKIHEYKDKRKKRFEEKVPSLNEFLYITYKDMSTTEDPSMQDVKRACRRNFPYRKWERLDNVLKFQQEQKKKLIEMEAVKRLGGTESSQKIFDSSARNEKEKKVGFHNEFPQTLKQYFFKVYRSIGKEEVKNREFMKLPFWAPPSSQGICKIHELNTCPPDCRYFTRNKKVFEKSAFRRLKNKFKLYEKRRVWANKDFEQEKMEILMKLSEVKECTFRPFVTKKGAQAIGINENRTFFEKLGNNLSGRFPLIYRYGLFKKAVAMFERGQHRESYILLARNFNLINIKAHFQKGKYRDIKELYPLRGSKFDYEVLGISEDDLKKLNSENWEDKTQYPFLKSIFELIMFMEESQKHLQSEKLKLEKRLKDTSKKDNQIINMNLSKTMGIETDSKKVRLKSFMCPLKGECPDDLRPRWPYSETKSYTQLGNNCPFAHHILEIKFNAEKKIREKLLKDSIKNLNQRIESDQPKKVWNPAGGNFTSCIGCGEELKSNTNKGNCATCQLNKMTRKKLDYYRERAIKMQTKLTTSKKYQNNKKIKTKVDESMINKIGFLQKATVLFSQERYSEAHSVICRAVELVKKEIEDEEKHEKKRKDDFKKKLGLDVELDITPEVLYKKDDRADGESSPLTPGKKQKMHLFANKMGITEGSSQSANDFLNYKVEQMYLNIENALNGKIKDIKIMKTKIEKLEKADDEFQDLMGSTTNPSTDSFRSRNTKKSKRQMCPYFIESHSCPMINDPLEPCRFAHNAAQLDLINNEDKIASLENVIKQTERNMMESHPPVAWKPTSKKDAIIDLDVYDMELMKKRLQRKKIKEDFFEEEKKGKASLRKTIYIQDMEILSKKPNEKLAGKL